MVNSTVSNLIHRADGSIQVPGYTWQCAFPVQVQYPCDDEPATFWRVGLEDEAYGSNYFDELDTLEEAVAFICEGNSDADQDADAEANWRG